MTPLSKNFALETTKGLEKEKESETDDPRESFNLTLSKQIKDIKQFLIYHPTIKWIQIQGYPRMCVESFHLCLVPCIGVSNLSTILISPWLILRSEFLQKLIKSRSNEQGDVHFPLPDNINPQVIQFLSDVAPNFESINSEDPVLHKAIQYLRIKGLSGINFLEQDKFPVELSTKILGYVQPEDISSVALTSRKKF